MKRWVPAIAVAVVVLIALCAVVFVMGSDHDSPEQVPEPPPILQADLPDFLESDGIGTIYASEEMEWHVFDKLHTFCDTDPNGMFSGVYGGYTVTGSELRLDPGLYTLTVGGQTFPVLVCGSIDRSVQWEYDMDGEKVLASLTYGIDIDDLVKEYELSEALNSESGPYRFDELPDLVVCSRTTASIAGSLRSEFVRLGGDPDDRQSYLDFIAGFVQMNVKYPNRVGGNDWDYGLYGKGEYWATPLLTLHSLYGDCEDSSALLCALFREAGFDVAMGGKSGHVFAGVDIGTEFRPVSEARLTDLGVGYMTLNGSTAVDGSTDKYYYAVETIRGQVPVGYSSSVAFGTGTFWGTTGFYPVP